MRSASIDSKSNSPASATAAPPSLPGLSPRRTRGYSSSPTEGRRGERASLRDADSCDRHPCFLPTRLFPFHSSPSIPPWWGRARACPGCDPGERRKEWANTSVSRKLRQGKPVTAIPVTPEDVVQVYGRAHSPRKTDIRGSIRDGEVSVRN